MLVPVAFARRLRRQQASPRSHPDRVGMACYAESREQCPQKRIDVARRKTEHRTNLARRRALRDQLECVSLRRCDLQDMTAVISKADLGSRRRRQEVPLVNHQRERLVAKPTPPVQKVETTLDRRCDVECLRLCCAELTSAQ